MKNLFLPLLAALLLIGCSSKREYFYIEDENLTGDRDFVSHLDSKIAQISYSGATLKNGQFITKDGVNESVKLGKNEKFLFKNDTRIVTTNLDGTLRVLDASGNEVLSQKLDQMAVAASIDADDLAVLTSSNSLYLIKLSTNSILMHEESEPSAVNHANVANPLFAGPIIVYPSLDGKIFVVDRESSRLAQGMVISNEPIFDTIFFLESTAQDLYIATPTRIMMVTPRGNRSQTIDIKNIAIGENRIFILQKDGIVKAFDFDLNEIAQNKFRFAIFSGALVKNGRLHILEKTGYLITTDLNVQNPQYFELNEDIDERVFVGKDAFYHGSRVLKID